MTETSPPGAPAPAPAIDAAILAALEDEVPDQIGALLDTFRAGAQQGMLDLHQAVADGRPADVVALAHRLKSSSRWVGATGLGALCAQLEAAGREGRGDTFAALLAAMDDELAAVNHCLDNRGGR